MARRRGKQRVSIDLVSDGKGGFRVPKPGEIGGAFVTDPLLAETSPFPKRSPSEIKALQRALGVRVPPEGVDIRPSLSDRLSFLPPVPGSVGHWVGRGTPKDPKVWKGIDAKLLAEVLVAAILVYGAGTIAIDVSNWWNQSNLNLAADVTSIEADVLQALGIQKTSGNKPTARPIPTFWTFFFRELALQGTDIQTAVSTVSGLSVGLSPGPPGSSSTQGPGPGVTSYNVSYTPGSPTPCPPGYTLMGVPGSSGIIGYLCVLDSAISQYQAVGGYIVLPDVSAGLTGTGTGTQGGGGGGGGTSGSTSGRAGVSTANYPATATTICPSGWTLMAQASLPSGIPGIPTPPPIYACVANLNVNALKQAGWYVAAPGQPLTVAPGTDSAGNLTCPSGYYLKNLGPGNNVCQLNGT